MVLHLQNDYGLAMLPTPRTDISVVGISGICGINKVIAAHLILIGTFQPITR
jgi:hypothetical protein